MLQLVPIRDLDEFCGWDANDISDNALVYELKHAWKDYHGKHSCPINITPSTLYPARDFCQRIGLPFRFFVSWSIQILSRFPQPWELNFKWLHEEIETLWLDIKDVKIALPNTEIDVKKILEDLLKK